MEIKIKYLADIEPLEQHGDWIDLRCSEDIDLKNGEFKLIPLGIAVQLPDGYEAIVAPRSSTFKKYKILQANSIGVIDGDYCGNNDMWMMPVLAFEDTHISKNDRICQFRILGHQPKFSIKTVEMLSNKDRGGFGTSGIK